jgi:protoporphyrin/coproporphyrin ferrochelatase
MPKKTGVILANLGSPAAATVPAVRQFLRDFLGDPRVVNIPRPIWWVILHAFVLPFRPAKSLKAYKKIWTEHGSPLIYITQLLSEKLAAKLADQDVVTTYAMRYGEPSIARRLNELKNAGVYNVVVVPLYGQYSSTTTASIYDDVVKELNTWRHLPSFSFISEYHTFDPYITAVADSIKTAWDQHGKNQLLVMSFHGLPELLTKLGDPYFYQCQRTAALIAEKLGLPDSEWMLVFQSRFGKAEWLKPYCADTLANLPGQGVKSVDIICPGFATDCLETLEEIAMENKDVFIEAGGSDYRYIPALNDSDAQVNVMLKLLERYI